MRKQVHIRSYSYTGIPVKYFIALVDILIPVLHCKNSVSLSIRHVCSNSAVHVHWRIDGAFCFNS